MKFVDRKVNLVLFPSNLKLNLIIYIHEVGTIFDRIRTGVDLYINRRGDQLILSIYEHAVYDTYNIR